jgi:hypothetical protein
MSVLSEIEGEVDRKEFLEGCQDDLFRTLFDKNNIKAYWELFEEFYTKIISNNGLSVNQIYEMVNKEKLSKTTFLNFNSAKYFISLIKDGIEYDNN